MKEYPIEIPPRWLNKATQFHYTRLLPQGGRVEVQRVWWSQADVVRYFYVTRNTVGMWPGTASDEWIEYVLPPGIWATSMPVDGTD